MQKTELPCLATVCVRNVRHDALFTHLAIRIKVALLIVSRFRYVAANLPFDMQNSRK